MLSPLEDSADELTEWMEAGRRHLLNADATEDSAYDSLESKSDPLEDDSQIRDGSGLIS